MISFNKDIEPQVGKLDKLKNDDKSKGKPWSRFSQIVSVANHRLDWER